MGAFRARAHALFLACAALHSPRSRQTVSQFPAKSPPKRPIRLHRSCREHWVWPQSKALTLQTVPVRTGQRKGDDLVSQQAGFSLHAGIACKSHQRKKLERLYRYITRPAIAERRLSLANNGNVVIALKTPYDDRTTHVVRRRPHSARWSSWGGWRR